MKDKEGHLTPIFIDAFDLDDGWFKCLSAILDHGHVYEITSGSYSGQKRLEFDYVLLRVQNPSHRPIIPMIPEGSSIPPPTDMEYVNQYLSYILTAEKTDKEDYTYGERLVAPKFRPAGNNDKKSPHDEILIGVNQIDEVIRKYKEEGFGTNQATMEIGMPSDITLEDPPCLRVIDTRVRYGKLHFMLYFRSWDLWGGMPANLGALQLTKEYMASEIGVEDGEIIAASKGLHLYDHVWEYAKQRTMKKDNLKV